MLSTREVILLGMIDALRDSLDDATLPGNDADDAASSLFTYAQHVRQVESVPDPMPPGWNRLAPASQAELEDVLHDALERVIAGDSYEGTITWTMPTDEPELEHADFGLVARYRIGNLAGQGGLRVFTGGTES
jgi:hypothetical protein